MPRPFYPQEKSFWYTLDRKLGEPQSRYGRGGEEKNSQPLLGLEPPIIQPVAQRYTTELSRLLGYGYEGICVGIFMTTLTRGTIWNLLQYRRNIHRRGLHKYRVHYVDSISLEGEGECKIIPVLN
jgi:hypothetical protein